MNKAREFLPFDALEGFREALNEKEKVIKKKRELSLDEAEELNLKILKLNKNDFIKVIYFKRQENSEVGAISKISFENKFLIVNQEKIRFCEVLDIVFLS